MLIGSLLILWASAQPLAVLVGRALAAADALAHHELAWWEI